MSTARRAAKAVVDQSNPVGFVQRLKGLPVLNQLLRIIDRFL